MESKSYLYRFNHHLATITKHKLKVQSLCFKVGLVKQGLAHDLSKYSHVEFSSGVKYYQGDRSPIDAEKRALGYSLGWLHHKGRNKHHYEYWFDKNFDGLTFHRMPYNYLVESFCDRIAACMTYQKDNYTDASPYEYFVNGTDIKYMNKQNVEELLELMTYLKDNGLDDTIIYVKNKLKEYKKSAN